MLFTPKNISSKKLLLCGFAALLTASSVWAKTTTLLKVENNHPDEKGVETHFILETDASDQAVTDLKVVKFKNGRPLGGSENHSVEDVIHGKSILSPFETGINGAILVKRQYLFPAIFLQTPELKNAETQATQQSGATIGGSFTKKGGKLLLRYVVKGTQAVDASKTIVNPTKSPEEKLDAHKKLSKSYATISMTLDKNARGEWALYTAQVVRKPVGPNSEVQPDIASQTEFHNMYMVIVEGEGFQTPHLFNK